MPKILSISLEISVSKERGGSKNFSTVGIGLGEAGAVLRFTRFCADGGDEGGDDVRNVLTCVSGEKRVDEEDLGGAGEAAPALDGGGDFAGTDGGMGEAVRLRAGNSGSAANGNAGLGLDADNLGLDCSATGIPVINANISGDTTARKEESFRTGASDVAAAEAALSSAGVSATAACRAIDANVALAGSGFREGLSGEVGEAITGADTRTMVLPEL